MAGCHLSVDLASDIPGLLWTGPSEGSGRHALVKREVVSSVTRMPFRLSNIRDAMPSIIGECVRQGADVSIYRSLTSAMKCSAKCLLVLPALLGALTLVSICALVFAGGYWLQASAQVPIGSDAIVVLGGDEEGERSLRALELYRMGFAPRMVLTGLQIGRNAAPAPTNWRVASLEASGVPAEAISFELQATNSFQEATNTLELMKASGWTSVLVVSDPPHMRRLAWTWGSVFRGSGKRFTLVESTPNWWNARTWWKDERAGAFVITEYIKLAYYVAKYGVWRGAGLP